MTHPVGHPVELDDARAVLERREMLAAVDRFIAKYYGERCSTVQGGCPCCTIWAARDMLNAAIFE